MIKYYNIIRLAIKNRGEIMPEEKTKVLEEKNIHLWSEDSPIAVCTQRLALDIDKAELFASFKLMNLQPDNIKDIIFDIICYDAQRQVIDTLYNISYTGFDVVRNIEFGYGRKVPVRNQQTRSVEFVLKSVINSNGHTWVNTDGKRFDIALEQESIFKAQGDLNKQFLEICTRSGIDGTTFSLQPVFHEKFWLCGCGCFNWAHEEICSGCGVGRKWLEKNTSLDVLQKQSGFEEQQREEMKQQYAEFEKYEKRSHVQTEEFEKRRTNYQKQLKKQQRKKNSKGIIITIMILILISAAVCGVIFFVMPSVKYKAAMNDFEMYRYEEAIEKFTELGNFADSNDFRLKSIYGYAFSLCNGDDPEKAAELFESLGNYGDAPDKYLEARYKLGQKKYNEKEYMAAADIFRSLGDYSNSAQCEKQCFSRIYREAQGNLVANTKDSLEKAYEQLTYIGNYKKSVELLDKCIYLLGNVYYDDFRYGNAIEKYLSIPEYEDVKKILGNIRTLSDLLNNATKDKYAAWLCNGLHCTKCKNNDAVYCLKLGVNGDVVFYAECTENNKKLFEEKGKFRLENNIIKLIDTENEAKDLLRVSSLKSGEDPVLSVEIADPFDKNVTSLQLHPNL